MFPTMFPCPLPPQQTNHKNKQKISKTTYYLYGLLPINFYAVHAVLFQIWSKTVILLLCQEITDHWFIILNAKDTSSP